MATAVDVKAFIDERPISAFQWFLVAMCFVVVAGSGDNGGSRGSLRQP
jgi:AAHS family 4-hydroxybenzoate transporter-like MFS transporter